jgi:hypothetical protein
MNMNEQELIQFNPILAGALAKVEQENREARNSPKGFLRSLVASCLKAGLAPEKIFAVIKTGRVLTERNFKFLSKEDIKEWEDACDEYNRLAKIH